MARFARLVLLAVLGHGLSGLVVWALGGTAAAGVATRLADLLWVVLLVGAPILYLLVGVSPRLPGRILFPVLLLAAWRAAAGMPLPLFLPEGATEGLLAGAEAALAGWALSRLPAAVKSRGPRVSGRRTAAFAAANLLVVLPGVALYLFVCVRLAAERFTGGFVHVTPGGVFTEERVYGRDDERVYLIGMVHVAEPSFYRAVAASVPGGRVLVLAEGATDREGLLRGEFSYGSLAESLGLESQEGFRFPSGSVAVENADVDVSGFEPTTIELLAAAARVLASHDFPGALQAWSQFTEIAGRPGVAEAARRDLLDRRNRELLSHLGEALGRFDRILVPWGAAHMPGIEAGLLDRGFQLERRRELQVVGFRELLEARGARPPNAIP